MATPYAHTSLTSTLDDVHALHTIAVERTLRYIRALGKSTQYHDSERAIFEGDKVVLTVRDTYTKHTQVFSMPMHYMHVSEQDFCHRINNLSLREELALR